MPTSYLSREDALAFIVEQRSPEILQMAVEQSLAMQTFNKKPVTSSQFRISMADTFPSAKWLVATPPADVDVAPKPTTEMSWTQVDMFVEEAATMVVIPENVLDDAEVNLWAEVSSRAAEAIAVLIDDTVFFGRSPTGDPIPATFPVGGLIGQAIAKGHTYQWGTDDANEDLAAAWSATMALVEADGYDVNQSYAGRGIKPYFRNLRDANNNLMYSTSLQAGATVDSVWGVPVNYVTSGIWDNTQAMAVMGDAQWAVLGIRQALTAKKLDQATIGDINLAEQDALGLRLKTRLGFIVLAPKGLGQTATPYPFAVLSPKAP
jgi:HK97 family phage major capsid protein